MIVLPDHYGTILPAPEAEAASQNAVQSQVLPSSVPQIQAPAKKSRAPAGSAHQRRTYQQPSAVGTRRSTRVRRPPTRHKAHSMHAPYIKLSPIDGDDDMDVDGGEVKAVPRSSSVAISDEATLCCIYCHDIGSYIWRCITPRCGITVCVRKEVGDHGCVDATLNEDTGKAMVTEKTFKCPQCYRGESLPLPYMIYGYSVRQDYLHRNYFPLLAIFLTWSGFGSPYASNTVQSMLKEQFSIDESRLRIATRALKSGNNNPSAMKPHFDWLANANNEGNLLLFINTHSDTETGDLVVSGDPKHAGSIPIYELLENYIGDHHLQTYAQAVATINSTPGVGPCIRGLIITSCGATGRVTDSVERLKRLVELDIFDFVLAFAGVYTLDTIVVPALTRFVENVYVYDMKIWEALEQSFGEDRHALNQSPVMLSFADICVGPNNTRERVVDTRVLAYSNLKDGRPWGLDSFRCFNAQCNAPSFNIIFHPCGKQYYGKHWLETKVKYTCLQCRMIKKAIPCPKWIYPARSQNYGRVWYRWPLTAEQLCEIGVM
ncbi:hypothetical protein P692DRAFT_20840352 [Suillus brevipes Sb2]|nr:hypothetical protein P692DRAFT_20840352 [Suillus brevipes Sb2]